MKASQTFSEPIKAGAWTMGGCQGLRGTGFKEFEETCLTLDSTFRWGIEIGRVGGSCSKAAPSAYIFSRTAAS